MNRNAGEDGQDGGQDAGAHVVDRRQGHAVTALDFFQEGDEFLGFLRRHFDVAQHDLRKRIQAAHQPGSAAFPHAVQMQDVTAFGPQGLLQARGRLAMRQGQIDDEFLAQIRHFTGTENNAVRRQLGDNFGGTAVPPEQSLAHITHHIIAKSAARRDQAAQVFGLVGDLVGTLVAVEQGFVGGKATQMHPNH